MQSGVTFLRAKEKDEKSWKNRSEGCRRASLAGSAIRLALGSMPSAAGDDKDDE